MSKALNFADELSVFLCLSIFFLSFLPDLGSRKAPNLIIFTQTFRPLVPHFLRRREQILSITLAFEAPSF